MWQEVTQTKGAPNTESNRNILGTICSLSTENIKSPRQLQTFSSSNSMVKVWTTNPTNPDTWTHIYSQEQVHTKVIQLLYKYRRSVIRYLPYKEQLLQTFNIFFHTSSVLAGLLTSDTHQGHHMVFPEGEIYLICKVWQHKFDYVKGKRPSLFYIYIYLLVCKKSFYPLSGQFKTLSLGLLCTYSFQFSY